MSSVKRVRFANGANGERVATISEVDAQTAAWQEAEERRIAKAQQAEEKRLAAERERLERDRATERQEAKERRRAEALEHQQQLREVGNQLREASSRLAATRAAQSRARYEQTRDWLVRQVEITFAAAEGRSHTIEPYYFRGANGETRAPNAHERNLSALVVHRTARAFTEPASSTDKFLRSLPPGEAGNVTRWIVGFVDACVQFQKAQLMRRLSQSEQRSATRTADAVAPATYLGVWKDDAEYTRGNMVTHDGTLWHCEADRVTSRPGKSPGWRLMHKSMERRK